MKKYFFNEKKAELIRKWLCLLNRCDDETINAEIEKVAKEMNITFVNAIEEITMDILKKSIINTYKEFESHIDNFETPQIEYVKNSMDALMHIGVLPVSTEFFIIHMLANKSAHIYAIKQYSDIIENIEEYIENTEEMLMQTLPQIYDIYKNLKFNDLQNQLIKKILNDINKNNKTKAIMTDKALKYLISSIKSHTNLNINTILHDIQKGYIEVSIMPAC